MHVFTSITDLRWVSADHTRAVGSVTIEGYGDEQFPFAFDAADPVLGDEAARAALFADIEDGKYGAVAAYAAPTPVASAVRFIPVPLLRQRIQALGMWDAFAAYLAQNPAEMLTVLTVENGVDPAYPALGVAFDAMDVPQAARDAILAPPSAGVTVP